MFSFACKCGTSKKLNVFSATGSYVSNTTATSEITIPSTIIDGDLAILLNWGYGDPTPSYVLPTGFTQLATSNATFNRTVFSYKLLVSGDAGATVSGMSISGTRQAGMGLLIIRGAKPITGVSVVGTPASTSYFTQSATLNQSISAGTAPSIAIGFDFDAGATFNCSLSPQTQKATIPNTSNTINYSISIDDVTAPSNSYSGTFTNKSGSASSARINLTY